MNGNILAQPVALAPVLRIAKYLLMLAIVIQLVIVFVSDRYGWDLDHEMYFGQRLLNGELIWTQEFHDKLPILQAFFVLPAWFKSIQVWRLMSLISCVLAAASIPYLLPRIFSFSGMSQQNRDNLFAFTGVLYISLCLWMPGGYAHIGGLTHINPMAVSFALMATLLMMSSLIPSVLSRRAIIVFVLLGGGFAATSISIRPYFIAPLALTAIWSAIYPLLSDRSIVRRNLVILICWGCAVITWGIALNFLPYLAVGHMDAFVAGLQMLQQKLNPTSFYDSVTSSISSAALLTVFSFALMAALNVLGYKSGSRTAPFLLITIAAAAALLLFVAQKHWWGHYIQFFYGYLSLALLFLIAWVFEGKLRFRPILTIATLGLVAVLATGMLFSSLITIKNIIRRPNFSHEKANLLAAFQKYRSEGTNSELTFLSPHFMYLHWQLQEPRHGFPHAANTGHIFRGWWQNISPSAVFQTPKNDEEYCDFLMTAGPKIIVATSNSPVTSCFKTDVIPYRLDEEYPLDGAKETLLIFRRK